MDKCKFFSLRLSGASMQWSPRRKQSISPDSSTPSLLQANASNAWGPSSKFSLGRTNSAETNLAGPSEFISSCKLYEVAVGLYCWMTCLFIVSLVCSQLLGAFWDSRTTEEHLLYGRSPLLGPAQIVGKNDVPYPDRVVACVRKGHYYEPRLVSSLLAAPGVSAVLEDSTGTAMHGYRLKQRKANSVSDSLDSTVRPAYEASCDLIASTIHNIFQACSALGYTNLTRENLRVVDDWDSSNLYSLPNTLPVLIMPFWDNAVYARHAIPAWGGDACVFRLEDAYTGNGGASAMASFRGVNQSVRHQRTVEWLDRPGGYWKNGWYEDTAGMRWYSDVTSSAKAAPYFMMHRVFDMKTGEELDCSDPKDCEGATHIERWGDKFSAGTRAHKFNSVYIANATEFGLFIYESFELRIVRSLFDWETLVSNLSVGLVLTRWVSALVSLHLGAFRGKSKWFSGGIGCISESRSFTYLSLASLPRMKMTLTAFWTVGCKFEGQQSALAEAWFTIYPGIVHFVLFYFSLLNVLAKILRRRASDALFTPTVIVLCSLHFFRLELAQSGWLKGIDGRVPTIIFSDEAEQLQLIDFFTTHTAWRMNGCVPLLFGLKLAILIINFLPLAIAQPFPVGNRCADLGLHGVEKALALRVRCVGGIGRSLTYMVTMVDKNERHVSATRLPAKVAPGDVLRSEVVLVNSYELVRLGYLVFGDRYIITFDEWDLLTAMAPFRSFYHLWNHRVLVWTLRPPSVDGVAELARGRTLECTEPQMWRLDDPRWRNFHWWQVSACSIQC